MQEKEEEKREKLVEKKREIGSKVEKREKELWKWNDNFDI